MITTVIYDLRVFLLFYLILVVLFSMIFAVLGVGNGNVKGSFKDFADDINNRTDLNKPSIPNTEFDNVGLFLGAILSTFRNSLGDFDFDASKYLTSKENYLYWFIWLLCVVFTSIIFLNFVIAETSSSYERVKQNLVAQIYKEKANLILEAEDMIF